MPTCQPSLMRLLGTQNRHHGLESRSSSAPQPPVILHHSSTVNPDILPAPLSGACIHSQQDKTEDYMCSSQPG